MNKATKIFVLSALSGLLAGCAATDTQDDMKVMSKNKIQQSYLKGEDLPAQASDEAPDNTSDVRTKSSFKRLDSLGRREVSFSDSSLSEAFDTRTLYQVAAQDMSVEDFLHYSLGELLKINYLLAPEVKSVKSPVTLNISEKVSGRRLFTLIEKVLSERNLDISLDNDIYLVSTRDPKSKSSTKVGVGRDIGSVPNSSGPVLQIAPILYGVKTSLKHTLEQLTDVTVTIDVQQSALFLRGNSESIVRALELLQLIDSPATRGKYVGLVELAFIDPMMYLEQMSVLLENEGIPNGINAPQNNNLVFVPLHQIGAVAIFAATSELLDRVKFWTRTIDQPPKGDVKQYFVFHPRYARATDIGQSLTPLLSAAAASAQQAASSTSAASSEMDRQGQSTGQLKQASRVTGASNERMTLVVDERSNSLIFYSSGTEYKSVLPLVQKLDVLPKQVLLEVVVAEVNLTDEFRYGVEWAITRGDVSGNFGGLGQGDTGESGDAGNGSALEGLLGLGLITQNSRGDVVRANFFASNDNVNILSRPSLLVRDGVTASINIGEEVSVQGATSTVDGGTVVTSTQYRNTGISISVTPTVNAQGVVIMAIDQALSNTVPDSAGAGGNPNVFERKLSTEVVAESGQTIMLAGLIEEQYSGGNNKVPGLGDLPLLGNLFKSTTKNGSQKELVLMITPRVINRSDQWEDILSKFRNELTGIEIP